MTQHRDLLGYHATVGALAGLTGVALADKAISFVLGLLGSILIVFITELFRPWLQRRARKIAGESMRPPGMP
jgi:hypothetical protein